MPTESVMMKCGCRASAEFDGKPCCPVHFPSPESVTVAETPNLEGRKARCAYFSVCKSEEPSSIDLWFFEHKPGKDFDLYYCSCRGSD